MTTAAATPPAPAAAPAAAPAPAPAAAAPAAGGDEPLFQVAAPAAAPAAAPDAAAAPAPAPAAADAPPQWLPEKYAVRGADGRLDLAASAQKLAEGYAAAVKRIGTGDLPPDDPAKYAFTPPEAFKDVPLDAQREQAFKAEAHKAGLTQQQYEFVMGKYFELVPSLLEDAVKVKADEARAELRKVWTAPADFNANMGAAQRAIHSMPQDLQQQAIERFGTDPVFAQVMAQFGREMREDRPPAPAGGVAASGQSVEQLMASEAYRDPRHPQHKQVSDQVREFFRRSHGEAPAS